MVAGARQQFVDPYGFTPQVERLVAYYAACDKRFFGALGRELDAKMFALPEAAFLVLAAQAVARDLGHGSSSAIVALQRARRWVDEGTRTLAEVVAANELIDVVEDMNGTRPLPEALLAEIAPIVRQRVQATILKQAFTAHAKRDDMSRIAQALNRSVGIGNVDTSIGVKLGADAFEEIGKQRRLVRMGTGLLELDVGMGGGMPRTSVSVVAAAPGLGKSMFLAHMAAESVFAGLNVVMATFELSVATQYARILANMTNVPIDGILDGGKWEDECLRRLEMIPTRGMLHVQEFAPDVTTAEHIEEWLGRVEDATGRAVDRVIIDYADRMTSPRGLANREATESLVMKDVYTGLIGIAKKRDAWVDTATQPKSRVGTEKSSKKIDTGEAAGSAFKGRLCQAFYSLVVEGEDVDRMVSIFVAKNSHGKSRMTAGPLPCSFSCGRLFPVNRVEPWGKDHHVPF